ncbi:MAG: SpoIIE family protein phosphatase [Planctomycetota bacterium]
MDETTQETTPLPRILITDDESSIRDVLTEAMKMGEQCEVLTASDGVEAQQMLREEDIDLVVTDLAMPRMDGLELMQWALENEPGPVWLILSGQGTFHDAVRAVHLGAFDFITKPIVSMDSFLVTVRNALQQKRLIREREKLLRDIEERNVRLAQQVAQLQQACSLLRRQTKIIQEDMRRAELIQRALLPREVPEIENISVDTIYRPSQNVGGDLYDVVRLNDRLAVAYVADAAGHGVAAAMLAVLFKHRIPMTFDQPPAPSDPSFVLEAVNRCLVDECRAPGLFVTAAYCLIDTETQSMKFASAGHPPPLLMHADGRVTKLEHTGPALGLHRDVTFGQLECTLDPGDRLLLYTDGLVQSTEDSKPMDIDELAEMFTDRSQLGPDLLQQALEASANRQKESQEDDITMVLLATTEDPSVIDNGEPSPATQTVETPRKPTGSSAMLAGRDDGGAYISLIGRANWTSCPPFHDTCLTQLQENRPLTLDLTVCSYMDSTFLGTVQELVDKADELGVPLQIQGVRSEIRAMFEELGMSQVLSHIRRDSEPLPDQMEPIVVQDGATDELANEMRILQAHEALADLSEDNRKEFGALVGRMREELSR